MLYVQVAGFLLVTGGLFPLALALARAGYPPASKNTASESESSSHMFLTAGVLWTLLQAALAQALLLSHSFARLPMLLAELLLLTLGLLLQRRTRPLPAATSPAADERLFLASLGGLAALLLFLCSGLPVTDWDSIAYHLPAIAEWIQHRGYIPTPAFIHDQVSAYPYAWEAILGCGLVVFHQDFLVLVPNVMVWMLFGGAVYRLSCHLGASRRAGLSVALLLLAQPIVLQQVYTAHIDLPFAAFFLAGVYYVTRYIRGGLQVDLLLSGVCTALLLAIKMSGVPYAGLLIGAGLSVRLLQRLGGASILQRLGVASVRTPHASTPPWGFRLVVVLSALWVGLFWYTLNLRRFGNPLGYIPIQLGSHVLIPGDSEFLKMLHKTTLAHVFDFRQGEQLRMLARIILEYLGPPFVLLGGMVAAAMWQRRRIGWPLFLSAACGWLFWCTPYSADACESGSRITFWTGQQLRYSLPALGLWAVTASLLDPRLLQSRTGRLALMLAALLTAVWGLDTEDRRVLGPALVIAGAVTAGLLTGFAMSGRADWLRRWSRPATAVMVLAVLATIFYAFEEHRWLRLEKYGATAALLDRMAPNETVGFLGGPRSYSLYGERLQRRLVPLNMPGSPADLLLQTRTEHLRLLVVDPVPEGLDADTPRARLVHWLRDPAQKLRALAAGDPTCEQTAYLLPE